MFGSRSSRHTDQHVAAMVHTESGVILLMASTSKSKRRPRLILAEELSPEQAITRVRQLADDVAGSRIGFTLWQALEGPEAVALTVPVDPELRGADPEKKLQVCLTQTPWTEDVIADEGLYIEYLSRSHRIHFAAVREDVLAGRERSLPNVPVVFTPLSHALVPFLDTAHPEASMPKGAMSLALLCLPRSLSAVVFARGDLLLVSQLDLTQYIRDEAAALREGQTPPFGFRGQVPQTAAELETVIYHRVLESAIETVKRKLVERGENPEAVERIYYAGEAVSTFDVASYLQETYGRTHDLRPILGTKVCEFPASTDEERETAQYIVANEARYATAFALLAMAFSAAPLAFQTSSPEPVAVPKITVQKPAVSSPNLLLGLSSALFFFVVCFMSYFWYLGYQIDADRVSIQEQEKQKVILAEYAAKRADLEAKSAHIDELMKLVTAEEAKKHFPRSVTDDVDRAMRMIPGVNDRNDPRSRLEWSSLSFDGRTVTISGTAGYRDNAVAFGESLGNLDARKTFTGVDTKWKERALPATEEQPEGGVTWDFTITAAYTPQPAAQ